MTVVDRIIGYGLAEKGKPYVYGDEGPNAFDCSGLMQYIFAKAGVRLPRTADQQYHYAKSVGTPLPGDLIFYVDRSGKATHVTLYLGAGKMLEAPHTGAVVRVQNVYQLSGHTRHYGRIAGLGTLSAPVVDTVTAGLSSITGTVSSWLGGAAAIAYEGLFGALGVALIGYGVYRATTSKGQS